MYFHLSSCFRSDTKWTKRYLLTFKWMIEISTEIFYAFGCTKQTMYIVGQLKLCIVSIHVVGATWDIKSGEAYVGPSMGGGGGGALVELKLDGLRSEPSGFLELWRECFIFSSFATSVNSHFDIYSVNYRGTKYLCYTIMFLFFIVCSQN